MPWCNRVRECRLIVRGRGVDATPILTPLRADRRDLRQPVSEARSGLVVSTTQPLPAPAG